MNGKRNASRSEEICTKKPKLAEPITNDRVALPYTDETSIQQEVERQSHGDATFGAITLDNGVTSNDGDEFGNDLFDDFDYSEDTNRQPVAGPMDWIQQHMINGTDPKCILKGILPESIELPANMDTLTLWKVIFDMLTDPQPRQKLSHVNTVEHVLQLLRTCKKIVILTGAGVSVSCGIPDFRSRDGIYARLSKEYPDLPDPQAMFDINYFRHNIKPFYKFAKEIYPGKFKPSLSHRFINYVEKHGQLLRNYTQNIDTLEKQAGITRTVECHGSFSTASCTSCKYKVSADMIRNDILNQVTPLCPKCAVSEDTLSVMKPDIVFFGESLPGHFHDCIKDDIDEIDLLIVIGSSLKVRPVALIPNQIPANVPQILINREPLPHLNFDVELLGDCDTIIGHLCQELGGEWLNVLIENVEVQEISKDYLAEEGSCENIDSKEKCQSENRVDLSYIFLPPCRYVFYGAELKQTEDYSDDDDDISSEENSRTDTWNTSQDENDNVNNELDKFDNEKLNSEGQNITTNLQANTNIETKDCTACVLRITE